MKSFTSILFHLSLFLFTFPLAAGYVSYEWSTNPEAVTELPALKGGEQAGIVLMDGAFYGIAKPADDSVTNVWVKLAGFVELDRDTVFRINLRNGAKANEAEVVYIIGNIVNPPMSVAAAEADGELKLTGVENPPAVRKTSVAADASVGKLRASIADREKYPDGSTITFEETVFNIGDDFYPAPILVDRPLTLAGKSRKGTVISGNGKAKCFVLSGKDVVLSDLAVTDGAVSAFDAEIRGVGIEITGGNAKLVRLDIRNCRGDIGFSRTENIGFLRNRHGCNLFGVAVSAAEKAAVELEDCTIADCSGVIDNGGPDRRMVLGAGAYLNDACTVRKTLFRNCSATNSSTRYSSVNAGAAYGGSYYDCTFEGNAAIRSVKARAPDAAAVYHSSVVSNCVFRGNLTTTNGALNDVKRVYDSEFVGNVSSNGTDAVMYLGKVKAADSPIFVRCRFEGNIAK